MTTKQKFFVAAIIGCCSFILSFFFIVPEKDGLWTLCYFIGWLSTWAAFNLERIYKAERKNPVTFSSHKHEWKDWEGKPNFEFCPICNIWRSKPSVNIDELDIKELESDE